MDLGPFPNQPLGPQGQLTVEELERVEAKTTFLPRVGGVEMRRLMV